MGLPCGLADRGAALRGLNGRKAASAWDVRPTAFLANPIRRGAYVPWELEWSQPIDVVAVALSWARDPKARRKGSWP
jgi:hypothetical protein